MVRADPQREEKAVLAGQTSVTGPDGLGKGAVGQQERGRAGTAQTAKLPLPRWQSHVPCMARSPVWESQALSKLGYRREALSSS